MVLRGRLLDNIAYPTRRGEGMGEETLFELPAIEERPGRAPTAPGEARVVRPMRHQLEWAAVDLESLLAQDHPARVIWGFVERLDLSAFYGPIRAVVERPGRPTTDPHEAKAIYRQRGAVAEWTNAQVRLHGVSQFSVRGVAKVTSVMLLVAVAHNLLRWASMG